MTANDQILTFTGHKGLRQRIVLSLLSNKSIRINAIRADSANPGITEYEASFIRLVEKMTNDSVIQIGYTGTSIFFKPGNINGGKITHECSLDRGMSYYIEPLLVLAPFAKFALDLELCGITNNNIDHSVDYVRTVLLPTMTKFGIDGMELKIISRGAMPKGGGRIFLKIPLVKALKPISVVDVGLVTRIRGIAYCTRTSPQIANRMQESSRSLLTRYIPDVYIYTDTFKGAESGLSPGYALLLVAETSNSLISAECAYNPEQKYLSNNYAFDTAEDLGVRVTHQLLNEIQKGGVDSHSQWLYLALIALGPADVGKVRFSCLTPFTYFTSYLV